MSDELRKDWLAIRGSPSSGYVAYTSRWGDFHTQLWYVTVLHDHTEMQGKTRRGFYRVKYEVCIFDTDPTKGNPSIHSTIDAGSLKSTLLGGLMALRRVQKMHLQNNARVIMQHQEAVAEAQKQLAYVDGIERSLKAWPIPKLKELREMMGQGNLFEESPLDNEPFEPRVMEDLGED